MNQFEIYIDDLTPECRARFQEWLGGDNGNFDMIPICTIEHQWETVEFVSIWDSGISVTTTAMYDSETGLVFNVEEATEIDADALDCCEREYVIIDGEEHDIEDNEDGTYTVIK